MAKRTKYTVLHVAIAACAMISVGLATVTTAQIIRNRQHMHGSAPVVEQTTEQNRSEAARLEKAERQQEQIQKDLRDLRRGN